MMMAGKESLARKKMRKSVKSVGLYNKNPI
jgi:hypothetical protein